MADLWTGRRTAWVRLQFCVGVGNAYGIISAIDQDKLFSAVICGVCMYITARWALPPPTPPKGQK